MSYEKAYSKLVHTVLTTGNLRATRNGNTLSIFGASLVVPDLQDGNFPILNGRQMFYKGVLGELAAILRKPTCNGDFVEQGCNYWRDWADADGSLRVDYGNAWFNFNGVDQIAELKRMLAEDPTNRRMLVTGWNPGNLADLSLPCCHLYYQFYVDDEHRLHMLWVQRSVDVMIGLPSDVIFAAAWLLAICNEFGFLPGAITMQFGDTHIYESHVTGAEEYLNTVNEAIALPQAKYNYNAEPGTDFCTFTQQDIEVLHYKPLRPISFKVIA